MAMRVENVTWNYVRTFFLIEAIERFDSLATDYDFYPDVRVIGFI